MSGFESESLNRALPNASYFAFDKRCHRCDSEAEVVAIRVPNPRSDRNIWSHEIHIDSQCAGCILRIRQETRLYRWFLFEHQVEEWVFNYLMTGKQFL